MLTLQPILLLTFASMSLLLPSCLQEFYKSEFFLGLVLRLWWNPDVSSKERQEQLAPIVWRIFRDAEVNMCPPLMSMDMDGYYYNFIRKRLHVFLLV